MFFLSNCDILIHPIPTSFSLLIFIVFPPENCQSVSHFKPQRVLPYPEREFAWMPIFIALPMMPSANSGMCFASKPLYLPASISLQTIFAPGGHILDIGCGMGFPLDTYLSECRFSLTGIDLSPKMLQKANTLALPKAQFLLCDVLNFQPTQLFDGILAFDSLWHVPLEYQAGLYPLFSGWLRPGDCLLFTHGKRYGSVEGTMFGSSFRYHALDAQTVRTPLLQNGFSIEYFAEDVRAASMGQRELLVLAVK